MQEDIIRSGISGRLGEKEVQLGQRGHILTLGPALDFVVPIARGLDLGQLGAVSSASLR